MSETELKFVMRLVDVDGDGTIEYDEFARVGNIQRELKQVANSVAKEFFFVNQNKEDIRALQGRVDEVGTCEMLSVYIHAGD